MTKSGDPLFRQMAMLQKIPRHPRRISTSELQEKLSAGGFLVDLRSIQRDLVKLSQKLPLLADGSKPQGWSWMPNADQMDVPSQEPQAALVFHLAEQYLHSLLPASTLAYLAPWFKQAAGVLDAQGNGLSKWRSNVRVLAPGQPLQSPPTDEAAQAVITQALLEGKRVSVIYRPWSKEEAKEYVANPLGLVVRDQVIYLVCTFWNYPDIKQLVLHRVISAELLDEVAKRPKGFNLDEYIARGEFGLPSKSGKSITLVVDFSVPASVSVRERPLSKTQQVEELADGAVRFTATVPDTRELRCWLLGFGAEIEVIAPADLRDNMRHVAMALASRYKSS